MTPEAIQQANKLAESRDLGGAWKLVDAALEQNPDDIHALIVAAFLCDKEGKVGVGYSLAQRAVAVDPNEAAAWTNLGRMCDALWRGDEAKSCYRKAMQRNDHAKGKALVMLNMSAVLLQEGKFTESKKFAQKCLDLDPDNFKAKHNLGMCLLAEGEYSGWDYYAASVGQTTNRPLWKYADELPWRGESEKKVVIYGEQGIGDEISAASMFPDAIARASHVVLECDSRLAGLYKRSFPKASVYGTRNKLEVAWNEEDANPDYSASSMQIGQIFRRNVADFPGTPYLVADPDRMAMWRGLWATKSKPVIGVAWSGGTKNTAKHVRKWTLEQLLPVFRSVDAHFVSLQYVECQAEIDAFVKEHGVDLKGYPFATLSKDYDDTAALVATLDSVVTMQQTALHIGGALGVKTHAGIPSMSQWRYGISGSTMPWYKSVKLYRQKPGEDWDRVIKEIASAYQ